MNNREAWQPKDTGGKYEQRDIYLRDIKEHKSICPDCKGPLTIEDKCKRCRIQFSFYLE